MKPKKHKPKAKPADGFYWEEWHNGRIVESGWHNGSDLSGKDATGTQSNLEISIPISAFRKMMQS